MIEISYTPTLKEKINKTLLKRAARAALENQSAPQDSSLSIFLTDDAQIKSLNRDYRGIDSPTDVLSFEVHERDPETGCLYLGEIIISIPYAARQAKKNLIVHSPPQQEDPKDFNRSIIKPASMPSKSPHKKHEPLKSFGALPEQGGFEHLEKNKHSLEAEVQLLIVHGILHLLGHDHAEMEEKAIMWQAQREILTELNLTEI